MYKSSIKSEMGTFIKGNKDNLMRKRTLQDIYRYIYTFKTM